MKKDTNKKIIIGFSIGDYNGIGPEILLKSFSDSKIFLEFIPVVFCDKYILEYYSKRYEHNFKIKEIKNIDSITDENLIYTFPISNKEIEILPGEIKKESGNYAVKSLEECTNAQINKKIDGVVTLPISKINSQSTKFPFPGHTEYFLEKFNIDDNMMIMHSEMMTIGFMTGHIPLDSINSVLDKKKIIKKLKIFVDSIEKDFNKKNPKIAVLGYNPHAGEDGLLGDDEINLIKPVINELNTSKTIFEGPFPADSFFGLKKFKNYDGTISWYHDQGLIGFKSFSFENGVNYTGGLPLVRTSPDHGTAFNIAGKGIANEKSLIESIKLNIKIINNRKFL